MQNRRNLPFIVMILLAAPALFAQQRPTTLPAEVILPEVQFNQTPFADVVAYLRQAVPGLQVQVIGGSGDPEDGPRITLNAKRISLGQLMKVLTDVYHVRLSEIPGPEGSIYIADIQSLIPSRQVSEYQQVVVYPLADIIESLAWRKEGEPAQRNEQALKDVLSLIEALIEQVGTEKPTLTVHPPTQTLLVKGGNSAHFRVKNVIESLKPTQDDVQREVQRLSKMRDELNREKQTLQRERSEMEMRLDELEAQRRRNAQP